ncbi:MAG: BamA/TamA family outer membrane protein [Rhodothermales bacterium]
MNPFLRLHFSGYKIVWLLLTVFTLSAADVRAQDATPASTDSTEYVKSSWVVLPSLFYSPRTKLGGGGSVRYFPKRVAGQRPSSISASIVYTAKKQLVVSLVPDLFFNNGKSRFFASALYLNFPDVFYGIGNDAPLDASESYTARTSSLLLSGEQEVKPKLSLGLQTWLRHEKVIDADSTGLLFTGTLPGSTSGTAAGVGTFFRWDTRNNFFYTTDGLYVRGSWMFFGSALGGDFRFSRASFDVRRFIPIGWRHVIALRAYTQAVEGNAPFQLLPQAGGRSLMRGYPESRYRDNVLAVLQAEYRLIVMGPIGFVVFGSVGDLQKRYDALGSDKLILGGGPGMRFLINEEGLNFRVDYGIGRDGGSFYFTLGEAF